MNSHRTTTCLVTLSATTMPANCNCKPITFSHISATRLESWLPPSMTAALAETHGCVGQPSRETAKCGLSAFLTQLITSVHVAALCLIQGEGVIWHRICEVSLLGGLGCGRWLLLRLFQHILEMRSYDFVVLQATHTAIPFYERVGFVRVGTVANARDNQALPSIVRARLESEVHVLKRQHSSI